MTIGDARRWCGQCDRRTRLVADGRRCDRCNPLAGRDPDPYRRRPWCGECDQRDRMVRDNAGASKCRRCHPLGRPPTQWPMYDVPAGYTEQLMACEWLCYISPTLRRVGADRLRVLLQRWFDVGWTPRDVVHALDHAPTGESQPGDVPTATSDPRITEAYVKRRLRAWLDEEQNPLPAINQQISGNRERQVAAQIAAREEWRRQAAAAVPPSRSFGAAQARKIARDAASRGLRQRQQGRDRELARREAEVASTRQAAAHWRELLAGEPAPPPPPPPDRRLRAALTGPTQVISLQTLWAVARAEREQPPPR
ncbi:hypothetical protein WEI85_13975 [Actinomycetes bacterium KLBMP 9797]